MRDPFDRDSHPFVAATNFMLPVLVDRAGGTVTVSEREVDELRARFGGTVAVRLEEAEPGTYRLTLIPGKPRPGPSVS
jgi:hypothetical protein